MSRLAVVVVVAAALAACKPRGEAHEPVASPRPDAAAVGAPTHPLQLRILAANVDGPATLLTLDGGADRGITPTWIGCVLAPASDDERCIDGGEVTIVRVDRATTVVRLRATVEDASRMQTVRLRPPPPP